MTPLRYFEDFAVGQEFALGPFAVTADAIKEFATEFDPQPFHLDEAAGAASLFGGLAASGFHTGAMLLRMICDAFLSHSHILGSPGMDELKWLNPVLAGDVLSGQLKVRGLTPSPTRPVIGVMDFVAELSDQHAQAKTTLRGQFMFRRRPA